MATWEALSSQVQIDLTDPTGVFHPTASVHRYLEEAELLLSLRRSLYERTQTLHFTSTAPVYVIHALFPDFIRPVRVTVNGIALRWSSLAAVGRLSRSWMKEPGEPESVFMIGRTLLAFAPFPDAESAQVTYLAAPPTTVSIPAAGERPVIDVSYHRTMQKYAECVALAKEADYTRAATALKEFLALATMTRDAKFLEGLSQKEAQQNVRQVERQAND